MFTAPKSTRKLKSLDNLQYLDSYTLHIIPNATEEIKKTKKKKKKK